MREEERVASIFDLARMCNSVGCVRCPIGNMPEAETDRNCKRILRLYPKEASEAILAWCDEHPIRTYAKDFLEKFPNAERSLRDIPYGICRYRVYNGGKNRPCGTLGCFDCDACWNETMKEEKPNAEQ